MRGTLHFDGSSRPNPGAMQCGFVVKDMNGGLVASGSVQLGQGTNNVAEYKGLIHGLEAALSANVMTLAVYGDSRVVIQRMARTAKKPGKPAPHLLPLIEEARRLASCFDGITFNWLGRDNNSEADALSTR